MELEYVMTVPALRKILEPALKEGAAVCRKAGSSERFGVNSRAFHHLLKKDMMEAEIWVSHVEHQFENGS